MKTKAFSLIELLCSMAIISIMASMLIAASFKFMNHRVKGHLQGTVNLYNSKLELLLTNPDDSSIQDRAAISQAQDLKLGASPE